jgi:hypothetical protein
VIRPAFAASIAMTPMSDSHSTPCPAAPANPLTLRARSALARALHGTGIAVLALLPLVLVGCIIPPSLAVDTADAGVNSPPSILSVRSDQQEFQDFQTLTFAINTASTLNLTLLDTDLADTLYAKVFVDYDNPDPTAPRSNCTAPGGTTAERTATCDLHGLCIKDDLGKTRIMSVYVFDRQVLDSGTPLYQAMPAGGLSANRVFFLLCQPAS